MVTTLVPAEGLRWDWWQVPPAVRAAAEARLGARVLTATTQRGGFSPGVAARLRLVGGGRAFVKAISAETNAQGAEMHRAESRNAVLASARAPVPRLLGFHDDGTWVVLLFEDIEGQQPDVPWRAAEFARVLAAMHELSAALTPAPEGVEPLPDQVFRGWRELIVARDSGGDDLSDADPWVARHLDQLAAREECWTAAAAGDTFVHGDLRADNILLSEDRVVFVDWPHAARGSAWFDLLFMLPSVVMQGGPDAEETLIRHPAAAGADPHAVTTVLAAITGMFLQQGREPAPPGLPTLRPFQLAQAEVALEWLKRRWAREAS